MKCIYCLKKGTSVKNSREVKKSLMTWRRRYCAGCRRTFTTTESAFADNLFVIKSNKKRQRFTYEKLFASLFLVFNSKKKRDNGSDALLAKKTASKVIEKMIVSVSKDKNISTRDIIILTYHELKKTDNAYADHYIYYSPYRRQVGAKIGK